MNTSVLASALFTCFAAQSACAQLNMDWHTVDGGGGESAGATLILTGTVGQPDGSGPTMTGTTLTFDPGFWPTFTVVPPCPADFNDDGFLDFFDFDAFVQCFEGGPCPPGKNADFVTDGFIDFFDMDAFVVAFETGC